jgi:hypothetical protein
VNNLKQTGRTFRMFKLAQLSSRYESVYVVLANLEDVNSWKPKFESHSLKVISQFDSGFQLFVNELGFDKLPTNYFIDHAVWEHNEKVS